ncbi:imidazole glycerol phosphate synthase subunit HisH [Candidatus Peribacteria bacterium]|nr:imidazole glycerol phosphate synthase subunit HisH [Candidatus Peribacteria bacterium]
MRVAIVDHGLCNIDSITRAVQECGADSFITDNPKDLEDVGRIILPGVGAFPDAMRNIRARGLDVALKSLVIDKKMPMLGICLGMQMLATRGFEGEETPGLGFINAEVHKLEPQAGERIPHVGWDEVSYPRESKLFAGIPSNKDFYFVHSYHVVPADPSEAIGVCAYAGGFCAALQHGNIYATQFHPEKSQKFGFHVLKNFLSL